MSGFFPVDEASNRDWRYERLHRVQHTHPNASTTATIYGFYGRTCPLSPTLVHLLDRMLQVAPAKRCALGEVAAAPWVHGETRLPQTAPPPAQAGASAAPAAPAATAAPAAPAATAAPATATVAPPAAGESMQSAGQVEIDITDFLTRSGGSSMSASDWPQIDPSMYRSAVDLEPGAHTAAPPRICRQRAEASVGVAAT